MKKKIHICLQVVTSNVAIYFGWTENNVQQQELNDFKVQFKLEIK